MTTNTIKIGTFHTDSRTFRGAVYKGDFDAHHSMRDIASRIVSDWNFDKRCQREYELRQKKEA